MKSILVVDDSSFMRNRIKQALCSAGFHVVEAMNGIEALECCSAGNFACIVTDLVMPILDGIGFLTKLREQNVTTPVVVLTADIQQTTRAQCEELGARRILHKPPNAEQLVQAIEYASMAA